MDKEYLAKHNLSEAQKKFQRIVEYVDFNYNIDEAEEPQGNPNMPMGQEGGNGNEMPIDAPEEPNMGGMQNIPDQEIGGEQDTSQGVAEFTPQGGEGNPNIPQYQEDPTPEGMESEEEEVIDVDDLTKSQEKTEHDVKHLDNKIEKLIGLIDKVQSDIDANNQHIEDLKKEFEKRNPTQVEKMTLRAKKGYPYNQTPESFWDKKEAEGDYSVESDNDGENDARYKITKGDIDRATDWASIYKSIDNGTFNQSLRDILSF